MFVDILSRIAMQSKQNKRSEPEQTETRKRHTAPKETNGGGGGQTNTDYSKDQIESVKRFACHKF